MSEVFGRDGVRCLWMRGGTSKGGYFLKDDLPADPAARDAFLLGNHLRQAFAPGAGVFQITLVIGFKLYIVKGQHNALTTVKRGRSVANIGG